MPTVPYSGVPRVDPTAQGTAQLQEQRIGGISAEAFGASRAGADVGRALAGFGQMVEQESGEWLRRQQNIIRQTTEMDFRKFVNDTNAAIFQMEQNAPANGLGHSTGVAGAITPAADKWLQAQPEWLRREYAPRMASYFGDKFQAAQRFQAAKGDQFSRVNIEQAAIESANTADKNPDQADAAIASGQKIITDSTLDATEKYAREQAMVQTVRAAELKARARANPVLTERGGADKLAAFESSKNPQAVNQFGYAGAYQFGAPLLKDLGVYTPAAGEDVSNETWSKTPGKAEKWKGTFNIEGFPEVKTIQDFLNNKAAQDAVYAKHTARMDEIIANRGWDALIGKTVNGVPITREGLRYGMHYSGEGGVAAFLAGTEDRTDANRKRRVSDYIRLGQYGEGTIADDPKYSVLTPDQRDALLRDGQREFAQQNNEAERASKVAYDQRFNNLWKEVNDGRAGASDIQDAQKSWLTEPNDIAQLENLLAQTTRKTIDISTANQRLGDPNYLWTGTSEDNKMLNLKFEEQGGNEAIGKADQAWMENVGYPLVRSTRGIVPPDMLKALETVTRSTDGNKAAWAYQQLDRMMREVPQMRLPDTLEKEVLNWATLAPNFTPQEWIENRNKYRTPQERKAADDRAKEFRNGKDSPLNEWSTKDMVSAVGGDFDTMSYDQQTQFRALMSDVAAEFIYKGNTPEEAQANAAKVLAKRWGQTNVGNGGFMQYPPEKYGTQINGSYDWMRLAVAQYVQQQGDAQFFPNTEFTLPFASRASIPRPYMLHADSETEIDVAQGRQPSYKVQMLGDDMLFHALPGRISFDAKAFLATAATEVRETVRETAEEYARREAIQRQLSPEDPNQMLNATR